MPKITADLKQQVSTAPDLSLGEQAKLMAEFEAELAAWPAVADDFGSMSRDRAPETRARYDVSVSMAQIKSKRLRWLWRNRLVCGYLNLWSGMSSIGKSLFACWLFAQITRGELPDSGLRGPRTVLLIASEDGLEDMWKPRLVAAGTDLSRVEALVYDESWDIRSGVGLIEEALDANPDIALVFVDAVLDHMPALSQGETIYSKTFIRRATAPLRRLAKERGLAVVVSTHPPKGTRGESMQDLVDGSGGWVQVARICTYFAFHPADTELDDQDRRRIACRPPGGSNVGKVPRPIEFRVEAVQLELDDGYLDEVPRITAPEDADVTWRQISGDGSATRAPGGPSFSGQARNAIIELLGDGEWHRADPGRIANELGCQKAVVSKAATQLVNDGAILRRTDSLRRVWWVTAETTQPFPESLTTDR